MKKTNIIWGIIIIALIILTLMYLNMKENSQVSTQEVISNSVLNDESKEELKTDRKNPEEVLEKFFDLYITKASLYQLDEYRLNFWSYEQTESQISEGLSESSEVVTIDGESYELEEIKTNIEFESYKNAMLAYMTKEIFEKEFISYCKNVNGMLHMLVSGGCGREYKIENMKKNLEEENVVTYIVNTTYYEGENPGKEIELLIKFEIDNQGVYRVSSFEILD